MRQATVELPPDDLIRVQTAETLARARRGGSSCERPVFVFAMPRSGTSLVEQITASHPAAAAAGEQNLWNIAAKRHDAVMRRRSHTVSAIIDLRDTLTRRPKGGVHGYAITKK